jgi:Uncharacterized conserved protein
LQRGIENEDLSQHIKITPGLAGSKPHIAGHRVTVQNIVIWHEWMGRTADEIANEYRLLWQIFMQPWHTTMIIVLKLTSQLKMARR